MRQSRYRAFELQVEFENGLITWVRQDELSQIPATPREPRQRDSQTPPVSDEKFKFRRMIEAFRLGIVPCDCAEEFTFGRDEEMEQIAKWLGNPNQSTILIVGQYGTGKTHLLHCAISRALQNDYAVAWVEMDPNEAPFYKPKRVYCRLIQGFRYYSKQDGQLKGFRAFLKEALVKGAFKDHLFFKYLHKYEKDIIWDWIEGRESIVRPWGVDNSLYPDLPGLSDYSTAANTYCYLLSALGWAARVVLGLQGLLLVFDEAETVTAHIYSYQFRKSKNFLRALICTANGDRRLLRSPFQSGLDYLGIGIGPNTPFLYRVPSGLKMLFAFTSTDWNYDSEYRGGGVYQRNPKIVEIDATPKIDLRPLTDDAFKDVFEHICLLYDGAYGFLAGDVTIDKIFRRVASESGRTRLFVKGSVEALDLARLNRGSSGGRQQ